MDSTRTRMITVALLVCLFSVGMAGLLNFFKYRSIAERLVKERLVVVGNTIEDGIQQSLTLGMQFSELGALGAILDRECANEPLIVGIEIFDTDGRPLYGTGPSPVARDMPAAWLQAARLAGKNDWFVDAEKEAVAGIVIENNFGLRIGYLGVRYDSGWLRADAAAMAWRLAAVAVAVFLIAAALASVALLAVMRRLASQISAVEATLQSNTAGTLPDSVRKGPFGRAMERLFETVQAADSEIARLHNQIGEARAQ